MQLSMVWLKMDVPGRGKEVVLPVNLLLVICNLFISRRETDSMIRGKKIYVTLPTILHDELRPAV